MIKEIEKLIKDVEDCYNAKEIEFSEELNSYRISHLQHRKKAINEFIKECKDYNDRWKSITQNEQIKAFKLLKEKAAKIIDETKNPINKI